MISAVSALAALAFLVFHHSEKGIELGGTSIGEVGASDMTVSFLACNPSFLPVAVEGVEADLDSDTGQVGLVDLKGSAIGPLSSGALHGDMQFADFDSMRSFVGAVLGTAPDPAMGATVKVNEKLLGVFPFSYEHRYSVSELSNILFGGGQWSCKRQDLPFNARADFSLAWARMSATGLLYSDKSGIGNLTNNTSVGQP